MPAPPPRPPPPNPPTAIGPYELLQSLGSDAFAKTWTARQTGVDGAIVELVQVDTYVAQVSEFRDAFLREATAMRRASHPKVLPFIAANLADGTMFGVRAHHE